MGARSVTFMTVLLVTALCLITLFQPALGASGDPSDRVRLQDVSVLTLHQDRNTAFRRSSPVPQLNCVGGTANGYFKPKVVQCYNRGSDGYDIQWECKTDMDNAFRFGSVEVTCEGYDYPEDPYILRGSCGLEYTLDFTEEGYQRHKQQKGSWGKKGRSVVGDVLFLGGICVVIYVIYKTCLSSNSSTEPTDPQPPRTPRGGSPPPPYGFRPEYTPGESCSGGSYTSGNTYGNAHGNAGNQGGGFWSGAATGGLLGYLFGRNSGYGGYTQYQQPWGTGYRPRPYSDSPGWFSGWGSGGGWGSGYGSGWGSGWGSSGGYSTGRSSSTGSMFGGGGSSVSSGTRTASGFGGTKRR